MAKERKRVGLDAAAMHGLTLHNLRTLEALAEGPLPTFKLAARLNLSKQAVSYGLTKLVTKGLIKRTEDLSYKILPEGVQVLNRVAMGA